MINPRQIQSNTMQYKTRF